MIAETTLVSRDAMGQLVAVCADGWDGAATFRRDQARLGHVIHRHLTAEARAMVRAEGTPYLRLERARAQQARQLEDARLQREQRAEQARHAQPSLM